MQRLVVVSMLASLVTCVACDLPTPRHPVSEAATEEDTLYSVTSTVASRAPTPPARPTLNITAVFEDQDMDDFAPVFYRALADLENESVIFTWKGHALGASRDLMTMVTNICAHFQGDRSQVRLIIVFGRVNTVQTVNLLSESLGIPVIGYIMDKGDGYVQVRKKTPALFSTDRKRKNP